MLRECKIEIEIVKETEEIRGNPFERDEQGKNVPYSLELSIM